MRRTLKTASAVIVMIGLAASATAASARPSDNVVNHSARGAVGVFSSCASESGGTTVCNDFRITYLAGVTTTRDGQLQPSAPELLYEHFAARFYPDGIVDEFIAETGSTTQVAGSYDRSRLTTASVQGATLDLFDIDPETGALIANGRMVSLGTFTWTAASDVYVFGNDGPFGFGLPRHYVDRCITEVSNGHERFTTAYVTGSVDGVSVDQLGPSYLPWPGTGPPDAMGAIFDNRFTLVVRPHGTNC